jgi:hypothetical protein
MILLLCSDLALMVLGKKIFKDLASFRGLSLPVRKLFGISEPYEQILKMTTQGTFLPKISSLGVVISEKKMLKEKLTRTCTRARSQGHDIRSE